MKSWIIAMIQNSAELAVPVPSSAGPPLGGCLRNWELNIYGPGPGAARTPPRVCLLAMAEHHANGNRQADSVP